MPSPGHRHTQVCRNHPLSRESQPEMREKIFFDNQKPQKQTVEFDRLHCSPRRAGLPAPTLPLRPPGPERLPTSLHASALLLGSRFGCCRRCSLPATPCQAHTASQAHEQPPLPGACAGPAAPTPCRSTFARHWWILQNAPSRVRGCLVWQRAASSKPTRLERAKRLRWGAEPGRRHDRTLAGFALV